MGQSPIGTVKVELPWRSSREISTPHRGALRTSLWSAICRPSIAEIQVVGRSEFMNAGAAQLADRGANRAPAFPLCQEVDRVRVA